MPEFILNRNYTLAGAGHMINFVKGQPTYVPPGMVKDAIGIGADPVDGPIDVLGPEEVDVAPLTFAEKEALMNKAFDKMVERNEREDFDAAGRPKHEELAKLVGFSFTKKEREAFWQKYRISKAEE